MALGQATLASATFTLTLQQVVMVTRWVWLWGTSPRCERLTTRRSLYIVIDYLMRINVAGTEIMLQDVRNVLYHLRNELGFKIISSLRMGSSLRTVATATSQEEVLRRLPGRQEHLHTRTCEAIYERRIEFPPYLTYINKGDTEQVEVLIKELMELTDTRKEDRPPSPRP